jgi:hypothetical protein
MVALAAVAQDDKAQGAEQSEYEQHAASSAEAEAGAHSMATMHEHMLQMRQQMGRIQAAQDPAERRRLMQEHMQSMQQHMQMMGSMRAEQRPGPASRCAKGDAQCRMDEMRAENGMMRERMRMMEDRLESMQQLMQQMMDHIDEAQRP